MPTLFGLSKDIFQLRSLTQIDDWPTLIVVQVHYQYSKLEANMSGKLCHCESAISVVVVNRNTQESHLITSCELWSTGTYHSGIEILVNNNETSHDQITVP